MGKISLTLLISAASLLFLPSSGVAQEEEQSDSCAEFDTAFQGHKFTFKLKDYENINTWQECGELCNFYPNCKYWTLRADEMNSRCRLKTGFNKRSNVTGAFSGAKGCPSIKENNIRKCYGNKDGRCECGDSSKGFQTYTFMQDDVQRCFTVFHPLSRANERLPVVFSPQCYGRDKWLGYQFFDMKNPGSSINKAAARYGFARIGVSTPTGGWIIPGRDFNATTQNPMACSDEDSKDNAYLRKIFAFIESNPTKFDASKVYATGFSQNSMLAATIGFCFPDNVLGIWQGGSGLFSKCDDTKCTGVWPIYPCYSAKRPMVNCVTAYTNDRRWAPSAKTMYDKMIDEGHDARLLMFSPSMWLPSKDWSIRGGHSEPRNLHYWQIGCLGITASCSEECETSLVACVNNVNTTTAAEKSKAFSDCMKADVFTGLSGCTVDCAPTFAMLATSENPTTAKFERFGAGTGVASNKPATSRCEMVEEVKA